jgi:outer membrane immunogenic protein
MIAPPPLSDIVPRSAPFGRVWVSGVIIMKLVRSVVFGAAAIGLMAAVTSASADGMRSGSVKDYAAPWSWSGCYFGFNVGYATGDVDVSWVANPVGYPASGPAVNAAAKGSLSDASPTFGVQAGCNRQWQSLVFGVEGDFNGLDLSDSRVVAVPGGTFVNLQETSIDWLSTLRGRIGIAFDRVLVYGTGGVAWANVRFRDREDHATTTLFGGASFNDVSVDKTKSGWVAGGGVEVALNQWLLLRGEWLHADLGSITSVSQNNPFAANQDITHRHQDIIVDTYRLGLSAKF